MIAKIVDFVNNALDLLRAEVQIGVLEGPFELLSRYHASLVLIKIQELLLQISYFFSIHNFDEHIHSCPLKNTYALKTL